MKKSLLLFAITTITFTASSVAQDASLSAGQSALNKKDYKGAQSNFTSYVGTFSGQVDAYLKKKLAYDTSNSFVRASQFADFKINHDWSTGYCGLGLANLNLGQKDDALTDFETAVKIDPANAVACYNAGVLKKEKGDKTAACLYIGMARSLSDTMKAAKNAYQDNFCWMCAMDYYKKGTTELSLKEYSDALRDLRMATTISPDSANYFGYMGMAFDGAGKLDSALLTFAKAIKIDSNSYYPYYYRGLVYEEKQKYKEAFNDLTKAISIRTNAVDAYIHRASVCENMDMEAASIYDYKQIIRLKPGYGEAYYKVALYQQKLGQDACDYFERAADLGVDDATPYSDECKKQAAKKMQK